jgi:hypothetical protein
MVIMARQFITEYKTEEQFTCFRSTKVQILTAEELRAR